MFGPVAQSVASVIADPGLLSLIEARSGTFVEIYHVIFFSHSPPSADTRWAVASYKRKY